MARIVVAAAAYLGDVAPFVRPASVLAGRGHDVTFLAPPGFHAVLDGQSFRVAPFPLDFSAPAMHADPEHERLMQHPFANTLRLARYWMRRGFADDPAAVRRTLTSILTDADVVVSHPTFASAVAPAAAHCGVPLVVGQLFPMMMPTSAWLPPAFAQLGSLGPTVNRLAWRAFAWSSGALMYDPQLNRYRAELGQPPLHGNALLGWTAAARTVILVSRDYVGRTGPDWARTTWGGFSPWDGPAGPQDPAVDAYLAAGDAPVLVCLGTSAASGAGARFARIAADLDDLGLRSLLLVGDPANLEAVDHRAGAFTFAPLTSVLPRCRAAVVSGALGTLGAALSAGVPVVVLPQLFDQVWHGQRVQQLGVGRMALRTEDVAPAVTSIVRDPGVRDRARALGAKLSAEDGGVALADAVEDVLADR